MTSFRSIRTDVVNAGADWLDQEVVADKGIVASRSPADLDAFVARLSRTCAKAAMATAAPPDFR